MANGDLSRSLVDDWTPYDGIRLQQGRLLTDDDFNTADELKSRALRWVTTSIVGSSGTWDDGFRVSSPRVDGGLLDFDIAAGAFFVGGHLLRLPCGTTFAGQPHWATMSDQVREAPEGSATDLVYLEVWEQPVGAVEDSELREVALGGPDTSYRKLNRWRVRRESGVSGECSAAWTELLKRLEERGEGSWDSATGELRTDARLQVDFRRIEGLPGDLCNPAVAAGYLGAENQTIRVQLLDDERLVWAFDNAEPLYRVRYIDRTASDEHVIELQTRPRDQEHWPIADELIELVRPDGQLDNGEWVGEEVGTFGTVASSWDPSTGRLTVAASTEIDEVFATLPEGTEHLYLRVWRQDQAGRAEPIVEYTAGSPVELGHTGLIVTVTGEQLRPGLHWVASARPRTRQQVVPWRLLDGAEPNGTRRWIAPLGLLRWKGGSGVEHDCRRRYRRLVDDDGCCKVRVGDGEVSHGDVNDIGEALALLDSNGGTICLLEGKHRGSVVLEELHNVRIVGCRDRTAWLGDEGEPVLDIRESSNVSVEDVWMHGVGAPALRSVPAEGHHRSLKGLRLSRVRASSDDAAAVVVRQGSNLELVDSEFRSAATDQTAVFLSGRVITVRACQISGGPLKSGTVEVVASGLTNAQPNMQPNAQPALGEDASSVGWRRQGIGGLQIGGRSEFVRIRDNEIGGGFGPGVILGSAVWVRESVLEKVFKKKSKVRSGLREKMELDTMIGTVDASMLQDLIMDAMLIPPVSIAESDTGCLDLIPIPPDGKDPNDEDPLVPVSEGPLRDVEVDRNQVRMMGGPGIMGIRIKSKLGSSVVLDLKITRNVITKCARLPLSVAGLSGSAAIAIPAAFKTRIESNDIYENAPGRASSGIYFEIVRGLHIINNRIVENGTDATGGGATQPGIYAGIYIDSSLGAVSGVPSISHYAPAATPSLPSGVSVGAARMGLGVRGLVVCGNTVIVPRGWAFFAPSASGATIEQNHFESRANPVATQQGNIANYLDPFLARASVVAIASGPASSIHYGSGVLQLFPATDGEHSAGYSTGLSWAGAMKQAPLRFSNNDVIYRSSSGSFAATVAVFSKGHVHFTENSVRCGADQTFATILVRASLGRIAGNNCFEPNVGNGSQFSGLFLHEGFGHLVDNQGLRCWVATQGPNSVTRDNIIASRKDCIDANAAIKLFESEKMATPMATLEHVGKKIEDLVIANDAIINALHHGGGDETNDDLQAIGAEMLELENELVLARKRSEILMAEPVEDPSATIVTGWAPKEAPKTKVRVVDDADVTVGEATIDEDGRYRIELESEADPERRYRIVTGTKRKSRVFRDIAFRPGRVSIVDLLGGDDD